MSDEEIFLIWSSCIYIGSCLIWLIVSYIYCHTHYDEFTLKEMIGFGNARYFDENFFMFFFPFYNTLALIVMSIVMFSCFVGYLFDKIGRIKLK